MNADAINVTAIKRNASINCRDNFVTFPSDQAGFIAYA